MGLEALETAVDKEDPGAFITEHIRGYYKENYQDVPTEAGGKLDRAVAEIQGIFQRNVFPDMDVTWGTYPRNIGHTDWPGCFRRHNDSHTAEDGTTISQDCVQCHQVLAWDEEDPEILGTLGLN